MLIQLPILTKTWIAEKTQSSFYKGLKHLAKTDLQDNDNSTGVMRTFQSCSHLAVRWGAGQHPCIPSMTVPSLCYLLATSPCTWSCSIKEGSEPTGGQGSQKAHFFPMLLRIAAANTHHTCLSQQHPPSTSWSFRDICLEEKNIWKIIHILYTHFTKLIHENAIISLYNTEGTLP